MFNKLNILKIIPVVLTLFVGQAFADAHPGQIKGTYGLVKPEYETASLVLGLLAKDVVEHIRFNGNYGKFDGVHPTIHDTKSGRRKEDSPNDWAAALAQFLFPSRGRDGLREENVRPKHFTFKTMDIATVGRLMEVIHSVDWANKETFAGAILAALNPTLFDQERNKQAKNLPKTATKVAIKNRLLGALGKTVLKVAVEKKGQSQLHSKKNAEKAAVIAYIIYQALLESKKPDSMYPPHIVQAILAVWVRMKAPKKSQQKSYYAAMPKLLTSQDVLQKFDDPNWVADEYTNKDYGKYQNSFRDKGASQELLDGLSDPELAAYIGYGHYLFDVDYPKPIASGRAKHPSLGQDELGEYNKFADCGSNSLRNVFNFLLYNKETNQFNVALLLKIAKSLGGDVTFPRACRNFQKIGVV